MSGVLRRFSSNFRRDKKGKENGATNGASKINESNGTNGTNGTHVTNGASGVNPAQGNGTTSVQAKGKAKDEPSAPATREEVSTTFEQFAQLIHASERPLPSQTGDGSYVTRQEHSSFLEEVKSLGFKDAKTLAEVVGSKISGERIDDKTYLMERVIQVLSRQTSAFVYF